MILGCCFSPFNVLHMKFSRFKSAHGGINYDIKNHLSFTEWRCSDRTCSNISGGIRSKSRFILYKSLSSFAFSIVFFIFPASLVLALVSSFLFSSSRSLIVTLYFLSCPLKFSICGNHFFSMERASSFFLPAFITLIPSSVFSMAAACLDNDTAYLNSRVGICLRPVCRELSPRSKSGNAFTIQA